MRTHNFTGYDQKCAPSSTPGVGEQLDIRLLLLVMWKGKWIILFLSLVFGVLGALYALAQPDIYQSEALLAPANGEADAKISSQIGDLASLAGVNLSGGDANQTEVAKKILFSRVFLTEFVHAHDLVPEIMATTGWDSVRDKWEYNDEVYDEKKSEWLLSESGDSFAPRDWNVVNKLRTMIILNETDGMLTLNVRTFSPVAAKEWTDLLIADINDYMRSKDTREAQARIAYLERKLKETSVGEIHQVFYRLIESETRKMMLANAQDEYVFDVIDPPVIPEEKIGPRRLFIVALSIIIGGFVGVVCVVVRSFVESFSQG